MENATWGIKVIDSFLKYLDNAAIQHYKWKDIRRFISFLGNIRQLMDLRLDYLHQKYALENYTSYKNENKELLNQQEILLKVIVKQTLKKEAIDQENIIHFKEILQEYYDKEKIFLSKLIYSIEKL